MNSIVIGALFGDEGKGIVTDSLCRKNLNNSNLVVRFNGGHQAGHTVWHQKTGLRHVFSSFGSGTLSGVPTFWSNFCSVYPVALLNEYKILRSKGINPVLILDPDCPVTTPYDVLFNRNQEKVNKHGSCGVGFGATITRHKTPYKLYVRDLIYPFILKSKLKSIASYYKFDIAEEILLDYFFDVKEMLEFVKIQTELQTFKNYNNIVFEGAQGLGLDMDYGFFPNVTHSNTSSKNAIEIIKRNYMMWPEVYYVSRCYQTRHGNGPMTNEHLSLDIKDNPDETNKSNQWQGHFRKTVLDLDLLNYNINFDSQFIGDLSKNIVFTCLDQLKTVKFTEKGRLFEHDNFEESRIWDFLPKFNEKILRNTPYTDN